SGLSRAAETALAIAVALAPRAETLAALARAKLLAGDDQGALACARRAVRLDPGAPGAAVTFATAALALDDELEPALAALDTLVQGEALGPDEALEARELRARTLVRLGRGAKASEDMRVAASLRPASLKVALALASLERSLGHDEQAAAAT